MKLLLILAAFLAAIAVELWRTERYFGSRGPEPWWLVILGTTTLAALWIIALICIAL